MIESSRYPSLQAALDALTDGESLRVTGKHELARPAILRSKRGVTVFGDALIGKAWAPSFADRATLLVQDCEDVRLLGLSIFGATAALPTTAPYAVWNDDGLNVLACRHVKLERLTIRDCGDSLLRVCGPGSTTDPAPSGVTAYDVEVRGCHMRNGFQISTTPSGVDGYLFVGNYLSGIVGSAKWSSRNAGAGRLWIQGNEIVGALNNRQGLIEIHGQQRVFIDDNILRNAIGDAAITFRDTEKDVPVPVPWNDVTITDRNTYDNCRQRIGIYAGPRRLTVEAA